MIEPPRVYDRNWAVGAMSDKIYISETTPAAAVKENVYICPHDVYMIQSNF